MGAEEVLTDPSSTLYEANYMGKGDLSDTDMVIAVRKTLASVQHVSVCFFHVLMCVLLTYVDPILSLYSRGNQTVTMSFLKLFRLPKILILRHSLWCCFLFIQ